MMNLHRPSRPQSLAALAALILLGSACTTHPPLPDAPGRRIESGIASWYGPGFQGKRTANGEIYDMNGITAAHKKLPFGTVVEVHNRANDRRVQVRINDRGPFVRGRIIDLSKGAADAIGMLGPGIAQVDLYLVSGSDQTQFTVQVGAFRHTANADELVRKLEARAFPEIHVRSHDGWHRVQLGSFKDRSAAEKLRNDLRRQGFEAAIKGLPLIKD